MGPNSPYTVTAYTEIWVESAVLIVSFGIIYLILIYSAPPVSFIFMECLIPINVRVLNFATWLGEQFKILGHIASSDYLSDGSRKGCNGLTKTT